MQKNEFAQKNGAILKQVLLPFKLTQPKKMDYYKLQ
jgi:hypothetical protein